MMLEHTAMYVNDLEAAREFFVRYFGAVSNEQYHNPRTGLRTYFLALTAVRGWSSCSDPAWTIRKNPCGAPDMCTFAFKTGSRENVDALTARLKADGDAARALPATAITKAAWWRSRAIRSKSRNKKELSCLG